MAADNNRLKTSDDTEGRKADEWLTIAIVIAVVGTGLLAILTGVWAWGENGPDQARLEIVSKFAFFLAAAVTFCTVVWRGLISARQANYQQMQLDSLARQITSTEENNLAQLLQRGAELIEDDTKAARVDAGIATLQSVSEATSSKFREQARGLIVEFIRQHGTEGHGRRGVRLGISALENIFRVSGVRSQAALYFEEDSEEASRYPDYETPWEIVRGVQRVGYDGGSFEGKEFISELAGILHFRGVGFAECDFWNVDDFDAYKCYFRRSHFRRIKTSTLSSHYFSDCDFSGVQITRDTAIIPSLLKGRNWFNPEDPPILVEGLPFEWSDMLHSGQLPSEDLFPV
ncbi:pentapeptide repeat-containing protein [Mesorhizobium sp. M0320]|uniref:hypothetical protein n=1 Tax=Mesorhizobium sp. M0320 TaxID=2956936 RepID=UPI00333AA476